MCSTEGPTLLGVITAIATLVGMALLFVSLFYRRPDAPLIGSSDPEDRAPIWKLKSRYRGPGFLLLIIGTVLWFGGILVYLLFVWW
ncbi:MAG: hypothetical protein Kow0074_17700 [Candidatus Zixiibacteriota bacterium]